MSDLPPSCRFFYFDLGNVLTLFDHDLECRQIGRVSGVPAELVREIVFVGGLHDRYERGDLDTAAFHAEFCRLAGVRPAIEEFRRAAGEIFELHVPGVAVLSRLAESGLRVGALSNTCEAHWEHVTSGRFAIFPEIFEVEALSFRLKSMKPERQIYLKAAELAGVSPSKIFFVDDRQENVEGARLAGYDAVLFTTADRLVMDLRARGVRINY